MAELHPEGSFDALKDRVSDAILSMFPYEGTTRRLEVSKVWVDDDKSIDDIRSQQDARLKGRTWSVPVMADAALIDKKTGKVVNKATIRVANLPKITRRYSYIVDGKERQVDNQLRLKSGVYHRISGKGELIAQWNAQKGRGFDLVLNPSKQRFLVRYGDSNIPLYPLLKSLGVDDDTIERKLGRPMLEAGQREKRDVALRAFYKAAKGEAAPDIETADRIVREVLSATELRSDSTKLTLGKKYDTVSGEALLASAAKLMKISRGDDEPDNREHLFFKDVLGVEDFVDERLRRRAWDLKRKLHNNIDRENKTQIREIITPNVFDQPIKSFFTSTQLSQMPDQTNPLEFVSGQTKTTVMGEGGISTTHRVTDQSRARLIDPTHLGFLDAIHTPEGDRTGITLQLPLGVRKKGKTLYIDVYDVKKGRMVRIDPHKAHKSTVAFPDQFTWKNRKPTPTTRGMVTASGPGGDVVQVPYGEVDYVLRSPKGLFGLAVNLIPFLQNNQGNRAMTAARQQEQALSLVDREAPLVQSKTESSRTFEDVLGQFNSHKSPVDGKVVEVRPDAVVVKAGRRKHEVQLYNHFPLNEASTQLHSTPVVEVGDEVKRNQLVADTNFTSGGVLALGKTLKVAYIPWHGLNFEDGIVLSEEAAKKLTSSHLHRNSATVDRDTVLNKKMFKAYVPPDRVTPESMSKLGDDGVIREGETVEEGDVLIATLRKTKPTGDRRALERLHKSLVRPFEDRSVTWTKDVKGKVVRVVRHGRNVSVHVSTEEPVRVGDKLVARHGNKGVVSCYDDQTEVLTADRGWVLFADVREGEAVAIRQDNGTAAFEVPSDRMEYDYDGDLFGCVTERIDYLVTPNHRMECRVAHHRDRPDPRYSIRLAEEAHGRRLYHRVAAPFVWDVDDAEHIRLPNPPHRGRQCVSTFPMSAFYPFMGWYLAEGSLASYVGEGIGATRTKVVSYKIQIAQSREANPETCREIEGILDVLGVEWHYSGGQYTFSNKALHAYLTPLGLAHEKYIPRSLFSGAPELLYQLLGAYQRGDGNDTGRSVRAATVSKRLADDFQDLYARLGQHSVVHPGRPAQGRWRAEWVIRFFVDRPEAGVAKKSYYSQRYRGKVYCVRVSSGIVYVRRNGKPFWCGNSIIPQHEMPRIGGKDGEAVDVLLNPAGVTSRINLGQILETVAGKLARKRKRPYVINNFGGVGRDYTRELQQELKDAGIGDTDELFNPETGKSYGQVLTGDQYILKLHHQVEKKVSARAGGTGYPYTINAVPRGRGPKGAQAMDALGMYALLAHGATHNIRDMAAYKSQRNDELWYALQSGEAIPPPTTSFAFDKFQGYLKVMGIDTQKKGSALNLAPLTDAQARAMSNGELKDAGLMFQGKDLKPERHGLFDPYITGGVDGVNWSHIKLSESIPNPVFERALLSLTGLKGKDFHAIIAGDKDIEGKTGPSAIREKLEQVDVARDLRQLKDQVQELSGSRLAAVRKKIRYLEALRANNLSPVDAYFMSIVPIMPPAMRPVSVMDNGKLNEDDINELYKHVALTNNKIKEFDPGLPKAGRAKLVAELYDNMRALTMTGATFAGRHHRGVMETMKGVPQPKDSFVQRHLISRRQDLSMRSTIIPEPTLSLDEVGIPYKLAKETYKPFTVRKLVQSMGIRTPLEAQKLIKRNAPMARTALEAVMSERPILLKRDPVLHKFGVMAFQPKLVGGKAIRIHPLVTSGYSADFDGNCVVGSSKVVLTFCACGRTLTSQRDVEEAYSMKFSEDTKVISRVGDSVALELAIRDVPYLPDTGRPDRHGALVYDVPDGVAVWSYDHETGAPCVQPVTGLTIEEDAECVQVTTRGGFQVTSSDNESLCIYDHRTGGLLKRAPADSVGALVPVLRRFPECGAKHDFDFGWMVGSFASDGFLMGDHAHRFGYAKNLRALRDRFAACIERFEGHQVGRLPYFGKKGEGGKLGDSAKEHISHAARSVSFFSENCYAERGEGRAALYKKLPNLAEYGREALYGVLTGLIDGDGGVSIVQAASKKKPQILVQLRTSSPYLVESIKHLCLLLGLRVGVTESPPKPERAQTHMAYVLTVSTIDLKKHWQYLQFTTPGYSEKLARMLETVTKDDRNIVPVPEKIMSACVSRLGPCAGERSLQRVLATTKSKSRPFFYVTRSIALRMLPYLEESSDPGVVEALVAWRRLVLAEDVHWDVVADLDLAGKHRVFDLIIPGTKIFAVNGGLVVYDTMSAYVPLSTKAVEEARKMYPSRNLFSPTTGFIMYQPGHEAQLGLYRMTEWGKRTQHKFTDAAEAASKAPGMSVDMTDVITVAGKETTLGRLLLDRSMPKDMRGGAELLYSKGYRLDKKATRVLLTDIAKRFPAQFGETVNAMKDMGNDLATESGFSFTLDDFKSKSVVRDRILAVAHRDARRVQRRKDITQAQKDEQLVDIYSKATDTLTTAIRPKLAREGNHALELVDSGARGNWSQLRQILIAPMLVKDATDNIIPVPITKSYSEGLDTAGYLTALHGARKGTIQKTKETSKPGAMTKDVVNSAMNNLIIEGDAPDDADDGISMDVGDREALGRFLSKPVKLRSGETLPRNTLLDTTIVTRLQNADVGRVQVRSPLKSAASQGIYARDYGVMPDGKLPEPGTNIGIIAAQALGEPATQLSMRAFHEGGVAATKGGALTDTFTRVEQLLQMPKTLPDSATLAMKGGRVTRIEQDRTVGGRNIWVGETKHYVPEHLVNDQLGIRKGVKVKKGQRLSGGSINPRELLPLTNINTVRNYLTDEVYNAYKDAGPVRRQNVEMIIRSITNLAEVDDPGSNMDLLKGDLVPISLMETRNKKLEKPTRFRPVLRGVTQTPLDMQTDWLARLQYRRLKDTLVDAALRGWGSNLHGQHPIPGMAYGAEFGLPTTEFKIGY